MGCSQLVKKRLERKVNMVPVFAHLEKAWSIVLANLKLNERLYDCEENTG